MTPEWIEELERRASALVGLSTTSSSKYDELKEWLRAELGVEPAVCFLSELSKQWTPRVGQALMGLPKFMLLLVRADSTVDASDRLAALHRYVSGLHATIVLIGDEGSWKLGLIAGTPGRALFESLSATRAEVGRGDEPPDDTTGRGPSSGGLLDFMSLDALEQAEIVWRCLIGHGALEVDEAIRASANTLRDDGRVHFERLRRDGLLYAAIENAISGAARRGILFDRPRRGHVRAVLRDAAAFEREYWRDCVLNVIGDGEEWTGREQLVRASAARAVEMYGLDMQRLRTGGKIDTGVRSAINGLIRIGALERQGAQLLRKSRGHALGFDSGNADEGPSRVSHGSTSDPPPKDEGPSPHELRAMVGDLPGETEAAFMELLAMPLKPTAELEAAVTRHLKEFEDAFEIHEFLDIGGAERLSADARSLLGKWPDFTLAERHLAQAAILYFVESDEVDDDFRIGGLRTDKLLMEAVTRAVLRGSPTI